MSHRMLAGRAYRLAIASLVAAVCLVAAFVLVGIVAPEMERAGYPIPWLTSTPTATPSPSSSASPRILMNGAAMPGDAQCAGCHLTDSGAIGLRPIPAMGHPLEGWSDCTACHATTSLVKTAPGHSGIHATECLICHKPGDLPAPLSRPHRERQNTACLQCHGSTAPLPTDMTHRSETVCWLCHRLADVPPPIPAHQTAAGETDCLTCHVAGKVGALPADHTARTTSQCLLCHEVPLGSTPSTRPAP